MTPKWVKKSYVCHIFKNDISVICVTNIARGKTSGMDFLILLSPQTSAQTKGTKCQRGVTNHGWINCSLVALA